MRILSSVVTCAFLAACGLSAQSNIRTKTQPTAVLSPVRGVTFHPGLIHGRHSKIDEPQLRRNLEVRIRQIAASHGLPEIPGAPTRLTYSLTIRQETKMEKRGTRTRRREISDYRLEIRLVDPAGQEMWTAKTSGEVEDWRHRYVEERVVRAATLAMAKYPGGQRPAAQ